MKTSRPTFSRRKVVAEFGAALLARPLSAFGAEASSPQCRRLGDLCAGAALEGAPDHGAAPWPHAFLRRTHGHDEPRHGGGDGIRRARCLEIAQRLQAAVVVTWVTKDAHKKRFIAD